MNHSIQRLSAAFLVAFGVIALALGYWGLIRQNELLTREDNPRLILEEQRIQRGLVVDRHGEILAETLVDSESDLVTRRYPYPGVAPAVGYYNLRHGVGGIEAEYDDWLRGDALLTGSDRWLNQTLHRPQVGGDVQLTLDLAIQQAVDRALAGYKGGVVVISVPEGEILAMSSSPTFDANQLDDTWDDLNDDPAAPLVNRVTQGLYQPGTILQSALLGGVINARLADPKDAWDGDLDVEVNDGSLPCVEEAGPAVDTLAEAYLWACPGPFQSLDIAAPVLSDILIDFGLVDAPQFELPAEAVEPADFDPILTLVGQSDLTVSPLQMVMVASAFANHGQMPALRLVNAIRPPGGEWEPEPPSGNPRGTISRDSAEAMGNLMRKAVSQGAASAAQLPGQSVYGHAGIALSGPEGSLNAWFIGFVPRPDGGAVAVAVLIEDAGQPDAAAEIGGQVLQAALDSFP